MPKSHPTSGKRGGMSAPESLVNISCDSCGASKDVKPTKKGNPRPPIGWKNVGGAVACGKCWNSRYCIRAVTIPIASCDWKEVRAAMKGMAGAVRHLTNWAFRRLLQADCVRGSGDEKMPAMPKTDLYKMGPECEAWETLPKGTAVQVLHSVVGKYRAKRYEVIWTGESSAPVSRYPQPVPFRADMVKLGNAEGRYRIELPLGPGTGTRTELVLAGGPQWRRQHCDLDWLIENPDLIAEAVVLERPANGSDHRPDSGKRDNGNGERKSTRMMVKIVGWFPIREKKGDNVLSLRTDIGALLVGYDHAGGRIWTYNADHAKRIVGRHERHLTALGRLSDDRKAERRKPRRESKGYRAMLERTATKDGNRMQTLCHELSASAVAFAKRRDCGSIRYDDDDRRFCGSFPWAMLKTMLGQKCRANGISLELASSPVAEKLPDPLATA